MTSDPKHLQSVFDILEKEKTNLTGDEIKQLLNKIDDLRLHADFKEFEGYRERYTALLHEMSIPLRAYKLTAEKYLSLKSENAWKLLEEQHRRLKDAKSNPKKRKAQYQYQHPTDPKKHWTGFGPRPKWFTEYLDAGGKIADLKEAATLLEKRIEGSI